MFTGKTITEVTGLYNIDCSKIITQQNL